jgi:glucokinase
MDATQQRFIGVDVGGTKIHAAVVRTSGQVIERHRLATPQNASAEEILGTLIEVIRELLDQAGLGIDAIGGLGLAVPGIVDYQEGKVCTAPNIAISGQPLAAPLREAFGVPVALGNDVDACTLGEAWVGSARGCNSAVGIYIGTGIGGGLILDGKLVHGDRYSALEIGHMIVDIDGPLCGCGNHGCLEAIASRTAIERDIRAAIDAGKTTVFRDLLDNPAGRIRSGVLKDALRQDDKLATKLLRRSAKAVGHSCISLQHLLNPQVIVLGGGVMEACGHFLMPLIEDIVEADPYLAEQGQTRLVQSVLGDDAGILGAAALGMQAAGLDWSETAHAQTADYPTLQPDGSAVLIDSELWTRDVMVRVSGKVKKRKRKGRGLQLTSTQQLLVADIARACKGGPERLFIATPNGENSLQQPVHSFLRRHAIEVDLRPRDEALAAFNASDARRAIIILVGPQSEA